MGRPLPRSILARQQNGLVAKIEADLVERKIRERNPLRIDGVAVAVVAGERRLRVLHLQRPDLKFLRRHLRLVALRERDLVQKPVSAAGVRDMLRPVRKKRAAGGQTASSRLSGTQNRRRSGLRWVPSDGWRFRGSARDKRFSIKELAY